MECWQTAQRSPNYLPSTASLNLDLGLQTKAVREFLGYLVSPEASNPEGPLSGPERPAWMGAVKALFWTVMATAVGVGLALLCN